MRTALHSVVLALAFAAGHAAAARTLQQVLNTGTLRVGVSLFAPWAARGPNGDLLGFEVDVARQLATDMGVKAEISAYDPAKLIPALESGEIDLIAAGFTITPDRARHANFSQPYAESGIAIATQVKRTADVKRLEDLDAATYTIGAADMSVAAELAARVLPRAKLKTFATPEAAAAALVAGEIDAYLDDEPGPTFLALEHPTTIDVPVDKPLLASRAAFAVNKGDADFLAFLNAWIEAREADTWLPTTTGYWFKSLAWQDRLHNAPRR